MVEPTRPYESMIATAGDRTMIASRWTDERTAVVTLCAAWCDTCTQFRETLGRIAAARPDTLFIWLDIEDDAEICDDIDVDNFPTLAIYRGSTPLHYGVSFPQEGTVARLIDEVSARTEPTTRDTPEPVRALARALR